MNSGGITQGGGGCVGSTVPAHVGAGGILVSEIQGSACRGSCRMKSAAEQGGGNGTLNVKSWWLRTGRNTPADIVMLAGSQHFGHCGDVESVGTGPRTSCVSRPLSTRITLPRATLTFSRQPQSGGGCCDEMHSGNLSASSVAHSISTIGVPSGPPYSGSIPGVTFVRRTAWRCDGSASDSLPVFGPSTSSKIRMSPTFNCRLRTFPGGTSPVVAAAAGRAAATVVRTVG